MKLSITRLTFCNLTVIASCGVLIAANCSPLQAQQIATQPAVPVQSQVMTTTTNEPAQEPAAKIPNDQLDSLVAPIALYPDPLVAQVLAASTYPLEIIQLEQWMKNNQTLKDKALADAVAKQPYDPSVQSLAAFPDVVKQLSEHVSWTMDLGNAFLAQQSDVMDAIQRMRAKAKGNGNLQTSAQQKVETQTVDNKEVIVIQPADPNVVYVPQYSPTVVYGAAPYYPYPYAYPAGYGLLAFGTGIALGAAWGGSWGDCDWHGGGDVNINNNNNFNRNNVKNTNRGQGNRAGQGGAGNRWSHNPSHRGGAPYGDRGTANKYGGRSRQQPAGGAGNRPGGGQGLTGGNRPGGGAGSFGGANRPGGAAGTRPSGGAGVSNRAGGSSSFSGRSSFSGGDRVGNRSVSSGGGFGSSKSAFGGSGYGGSSARSASSRGGRSMGGGGFSGGGGRGGGGRGGGGGRRR